MSDNKKKFKILLGVLASRHDWESLWFAKPSTYETLIHYNLPA